MNEQSIWTPGHKLKFFKLEAVVTANPLIIISVFMTKVILGHEQKSAPIANFNWIHIKNCWS